VSLRTVPLAALALILAAGPLLAGPDAQEQMKKQRDEKLSHDWVKKFPWVTDYAAAKAEAKKSGKMIFAYFSRSYAP
jgi:hypothetical protein